MRNYAASLLIVGIVGAPTFTQASGLFVSFFNTDSVALYDGQTGALLNGNFASVQDTLGVAVGPDHNLYVGSDNLGAPTESGAAVVRFGINGTTGTPNGVFAGHSGNNNLNNPQGLAFSGGNLYIADATTGSVFVYNPAGVLVNTLPGLGAPAGITFDLSGTLYVADQNQSDIFKYNGTSFVPINSQPALINDGRDVAVTGGFAYALDASASGGIYKISLADGSAQKIVDYNGSLFQASNLTLGPDGNLYVSGQDLETADGEILEYGRDGSGGGQFIDTGFLTSPGYLTFDVPEPSVLSLAGLAAAVFAIARRKRQTA